MKKIFFVLFIILTFNSYANAEKYTVQETHYISEHLTITKEKYYITNKDIKPKVIRPREKSKRYATSLELYRNTKK